MNKEEKHWFDMSLDDRYDYLMSCYDETEIENPSKLILLSFNKLPKIVQEDIRGYIMEACL